MKDLFAALARYTAAGGHPVSVSFSVSALDCRPFVILNFADCDDYKNRPPEAFVHASARDTVARVKRILANNIPKAK